MQGYQGVLKELEPWQGKHTHKQKQQKPHQLLLVKLISLTDLSDPTFLRSEHALKTLYEKDIAILAA